MSAFAESSCHFQPCVDDWNLNDRCRVPLVFLVAHDAGLESVYRLEVEAKRSQGMGWYVILLLVSTHFLPPEFNLLLLHCIGNSVSTTKCDEGCIIYSRPRSTLSNMFTHEIDKLL